MGKYPGTQNHSREKGYKIIPEIQNQYKQMQKGRNENKKCPPKMQYKYKRIEDDLNVKQNAPKTQKKPER